MEILNNVDGSGKENTYYGKLILRSFDDPFYLCKTELSKIRVVGKVIQSKLGD